MSLAVRAAAPVAVHHHRAELERELKLWHYTGIVAAVAAFILGTVVGVAIVSYRTYSSRLPGGWPYEESYLLTANNYAALMLFIFSAYCRNKAQRIYYQIHAHTD